MARTTAWYKKRINALEEKLAESEKLGQTRQSSLDVAIHQIDGKNEQIKMDGKAIEDQKRTIADLERKIKSLNSELECYKSEKLAHERKIRDLDDEVGRVQDAVRVLAQVGDFSGK